MQIHGILETALYVADVDRSAAFYRRLFGFPTLLESDRLVALAIDGRDVLLLFPVGATSQPLPTAGGVIPPHGGSGWLHLALAIAADDWDGWKRRLAAEAVPVESEVTWPTGARSLYFRDPDGHSVELATPGLWSFP